MLVHDPLDPLRRDTAIDDPLRPDQQHRAIGADAQAVGLGAQHHTARAIGLLQAQLPHQALQGFPAGQAKAGIGAAEGLAGGGAEQQVMGDQTGRAAASCTA